MIIFLEPFCNLKLNNLAFCAFCACECRRMALSLPPRNALVLGHGDGICGEKRGGSRSDTASSSTGLPTLQETHEDSTLIAYLAYHLK